MFANHPAYLYYVVKPGILLCLVKYTMWKGAKCLKVPGREIRRIFVIYSQYPENEIVFLKRGGL